MTADTNYHTREMLHFLSLTHITSHQSLYNKKSSNQPKQKDEHEHPSRLNNSLVRCSHDVFLLAERTTNTPLYYMLCKYSSSFEQKKDINRGAKRMSLKSMLISMNFRNALFELYANTIEKT